MSYLSSHIIMLMTVSRVVSILIQEPLYKTSNDCLRVLVLKYYCYTLALHSNYVIILNFFYILINFDMINA